MRQGGPWGPHCESLGAPHADSTKHHQVPTLLLLQLLCLLPELLPGLLRRLLLPPLLLPWLSLLQSLVRRELVGAA